MNNQISIYTLANYIIGLYDSLNEKFVSSQIKIAKLLVISEIYSQYKYEKGLLPESTEYLFSQCGIKIPALEAPIGGIRIYISSGIEINEKPKFTDEEIEKIEHPEFQFFTAENIKSIQNINSETKYILKDVFKNFASYDAGRIGQLLNELKPEELVGEVGLRNFESIKKVVQKIQRNAIKDNDIVTFVRENQKSLIVTIL